MITIEQNIDQFYEETEQSVKGIMDGSDDHLDMILSVTQPLEELSLKFEALNDSLFNSIHTYSDEQIQTVIMPKLRQLNKSCVTLIGAIRTSFLYRDVRTALKNYSKQYDVFRELLHDIQHFRINKDDEFERILKELNDL